MNERILIVDDHRLTAAGTASLLRDYGYLVDAVYRVADLTDALNASPPDLALVDMVFSKERQSGLNAIEILLAQSPTTRIVLFTAGDDSRRHHLAAALATLGVSGGIPKDAEPSTLSDCVRTVLNGGTYFDPEIEAFRPSPRLSPSLELMRTPTHAAIWYALAAGYTSREEIADATHYSARSIGNAIGPMGDKLRALGLTSDEKVTLADLAGYAGRHRDYFLNWRRRQTPPDIKPR